MAYSRSDWVTIVLCVVFPILFVLAILGWRTGKKLGVLTLSDFFTQKRRVNVVFLIPAFLFAGGGSFLINRPGDYASRAGVLGLCMYCIWLALSVVIIALIGKWIRGAVDGAESISDFVSARFGPLAELYVALLVLFNTAVLLLTEYSNIRLLFMSYVRAKGWAVVLFVGVTAFIIVLNGGLKSVVTVHLPQLLLIGISSIMIASYVGAKFKGELPKNLTNEQQGFTDTGYSTIILFPMILISSAFFNESLWQKCWAATGNPGEKDKNVTLGAIGGAVLLFGFSFATGYMALCAQWTGLVPEGTPAYLTFFSIFEPIARTPVIRSWIGVVVSLAAALFSQGSVSAYQNALTNTATAYMFRTQTAGTGKFICFVLNVPILAIACTGYKNIPKITRLATLLSATSVFPVAAGTLLIMVELYTGDMMLFSCILSIIGTCIFGVYHNKEKTPGGETDLAKGLINTWWTTSYNWKYFLVAIMSSVLAVVLCIVIGLLLAMLGWKWFNYLSPSATWTRVQTKMQQSGKEGPPKAAQGKK